MQLIYQEIYHRLYLELVLAHMTTANMWNISPHRLWDEGRYRSQGKRHYNQSIWIRTQSQKNAHLSTLQDLMAGRHTEIDMFAGTMVAYGQELGIPSSIL